MFQDTINNKSSTLGSLFHLYLSLSAVPSPLSPLLFLLLIRLSSKQILCIVRSLCATQEHGWILPRNGQPRIVLAKGNSMLESSGWKQQSQLLCHLPMLTPGYGEGGREHSRHRLGMSRGGAEIHYTDSPLV